jgi:hypothetical protein
VYELTTKKDIIRSLNSIDELDKLLIKDLVPFVDGYQEKVVPILKSVCQIQIQQHPLLFELMTVIVEKGIEIQVDKSTVSSPFVRSHVAPNIVLGWLGDREGDTQPTQVN